MKTPIVLKKIKTHNGVFLTVKSWAKEIMTSNRIDAKVKSVDFDQLFTTVYLGEGNFSLCDTICDLEDEDREISRSGIFHFTADIEIITKALGCSQEDKQSIIDAVMKTRKQLRSQA